MYKSSEVGIIISVIADNIEERTVLSAELVRYIGEVITVLEQGDEHGYDFVHSRLDYLCTIVARYVGELHLSLPSINTNTVYSISLLSR